MWKLTALIAVAVFACLLIPFTILGLMFFGPMVVATVADWFCRA